MLDSLLQSLSILPMYAVSYTLATPIIPSTLYGAIATEVRVFLRLLAIMCIKTRRACSCLLQKKQLGTHMTEERKRCQLYTAWTLSRGVGCGSPCLPYPRPRAPGNQRQVCCQTREKLEQEREPRRCQAREAQPTERNIMCNMFSFVQKTTFASTTDINRQPLAAERTEASRGVDAAPPADRAPPHGRVAAAQRDRLQGAHILWR